MVAAAIIVACAISIQTTIALGIVLAPGETALVDTCGIRRADPADDCVQDCAGTCGAANWDSCGVCDDDTTNDCVQDCAGMWGGNAVEDVCGTCDDDPTNDCVLTDCAGTLGGSAVLDDCGVCDEDDSNDNTTCYKIAPAPGVERLR